MQQLRGAVMTGGFPARWFILSLALILFYVPDVGYFFY